LKKKERKLGEKESFLHSKMDFCFFCCTAGTAVVVCMSCGALGSNESKSSELPVATSERSAFTSDGSTTEEVVVASSCEK
jgi:hypothetical protein